VSICHWRAVLAASVPREVLCRSMPSVSASGPMLIMRCANPSADVGCSQEPVEAAKPVKITAASSSVALGNAQQP
jgi:hypothetical protein